MIHDALIIGGGPAGATTAWLLARAGWSVVLVEKKIFPRRKVCGEYLSATTLPLLRKLGLGEAFLDLAGPPVREVGIYAGGYQLRAPMPAGDQAGALGRALGREHLDTLLLAGAGHAGAEILQAHQATEVERRHGIFHCRTQAPAHKTREKLKARVVIAAHGSWEHGKLPTQMPDKRARPSDLLAFKAHFTHTELPSGLMPLLAFPGGYGGMVHTDHGRVSLSCCIRRDTLARLRAGQHGSAGAAVLAHIMQHCDGVRQALSGAQREGAWLASGPLQTGVRRLHRDGIFAVGNAAGEAHPVVAEGLSMAMQGAWILSAILGAGREQVLQGETGASGTAYARAWRRHFGPRLRAAALFAHLAMRPAATQLLLPLLQCLPSLLTACTRLSGKTTPTLSVTN